MSIDRRKFLKIAGMAAAGTVAGKTAFELMWPGQAEANQLLANKSAWHAKRWAMAVDLKKVSGNDALLAKLRKACHTAHNVPDIPVHNNEIKWIWQENFENAFPNINHRFESKKYMGKKLVVMCNQCDNPPCVRVCPTQATFRRDDGIVMMDFHRCIGCRFCMAACPYGSRSFNFGNPRLFLKDPPPNEDFPTRGRGVVEKCNFCAERLAVGKKPACVEASGGALAFGDLYDASSDVRKLLATRYSIRRKSMLGTEPHVFYIV